MCEKVLLGSTPVIVLATVNLLSLSSILLFWHCEGHEYSQLVRPVHIRATARLATSPLKKDTLIPMGLSDLIKCYIKK